jgi:hypothetical protein
VVDVIDAGRTWVCTRKPTLLYNAETSGQKEFLLRLCEEVRAGRWPIRDPSFLSASQ